MQVCGGSDLAREAARLRAHAVARVSRKRLPEAGGDTESTGGPRHGMRPRPP